MPIELTTLGNIPFFSLLTKDELTEFAGRTRAAAFEPYRTIYRAGETNCSMYMLLVGKVRIFISENYGREIVVAHLAPGEVFGKLSESGNDRCSDTAVALVETHLISLDRSNLRYLFSVRPDTALEMIGDWKHTCGGCVVFSAAARPS